MRYQVGGTLRNDDPTYIERQADTALYRGLLEGDFCSVLNARQMGKSSLLVRTKYRLTQQGYRCATLDMANIGTEDITPPQWYLGLIAELCLQFDLDLDLSEWWAQQSCLSLPQRLMHFFFRVLLEAFPKTNLCIFIDEIDSVLALPFTVDDFFMTIRSCYNQRSLTPSFQHLTFAFFGVATPSDLLQNKRNSPFNIGRSISLDGFSLAEAQPLANGLASSSAVAESVLKDIFYWTEGQPFLTQKLCRLLSTSISGLNADDYYQKFPKSDAHPTPTLPLLRGGSSGDLPPSLSQSVSAGHRGTEGDSLGTKESRNQGIVDAIVQQYIIDNWEAQDEPEHLRTISHRIIHHPYMGGRLLGIYQRILTEGRHRIDHSPEQLELLLSGLVVEDRGQLLVKNPVYAAVFTSEWVSQQLENLRPYTADFQAWLTTRQETHLLTGLALKEALAWSQDKQLSDLDYRFLNASQRQAQAQTEQELVAERTERQYVETLLKTAETARELLATAQAKAKQQCRTYRLPSLSVAVIGVLSAIAIQLISLTGLLQPLNWSGLDLLFQLRPTLSPSEHVTLLTIDEPDIQAVGQYPFSDQVLTDILVALDRYQPRSIGLDLFRDLPNEPGHQALVQQWQQMPHLVGIEKIVGTPIPGPPELVQRDQVGMADQVVDGDGKVRRMLLSLRNDDGLHLGLALKLALVYLEQEEITPTPLDNNQIQLGQARLKPFLPNDGGYVRADAGGYQMLLNYRGTRHQFETISLTDLLAGRVKREAIADRIVLIGAIAETVNDLAETPYSHFFNPSRRNMAGVTIHANMTDQLVSAALGERPLLYACPGDYGWLGIMLAAFLGAMVGNLRRSLWVSIAVLVSVAGLLTITLAAFSWGCWLPWVPMLMAGAIATTVVLILIQQRVQTQEQQYVIQELNAIADQYPVASQLAFDYLKQRQDKKLS